MSKFVGTFLGSGAVRYIGLGFVPTKVKIQNIHAADLARIEWQKQNSAYATAAEGILFGITTGAETAAALTVGTGVAPYYGGDVVAAAAVTHIIPVGEIAAYNGDQRGKGSAGTVTAWTIDTAGSFTGHFDKLVDTTYVGVGSKVLIRGKDTVVREYNIVALSNDGDAANDVTLDRLAASGDVVYISYLYDMAAAPAGTVMPAGIYLAETAACNATSELCFNEAEC